MLKKLLLALLVALLPTPLLAAYAQWQATATSASGSPLRGYNVKVLEHPSGTPATVYSDDQGTELEQPFQTNSTDGTYGFWTGADGDYKIVVYGLMGTYQTVYISVSGTSISSSGIDISTVNLVPKTLDGQQTITATGTGNGIDLVAEEGSISLSAQGGASTVVADDGGAGLRSTLAGGVVQLYTSQEESNIEIIAAGDESTIFLNAMGDEGAVSMTATNVTTMATNNVLNTPGGNSIAVHNNTGTYINGPIAIGPRTGPPVACDAGSLGSIYVDSDISLPCFCNGTNWVRMTDFSTTTGCSNPE